MALTHLVSLVLYHIGNEHSFNTMNNTMQILHFHKKSAHLNTVERYYIHAEFAADSHLNDSQNIFPNPIFDAILKTH